jgi:hypothetical protein
MILVPGIMTIIMSYPISPLVGLGKNLLTCLGRTELFYDFDYFKEGGGYANIYGVSPCLERSGSLWLLCVGTQSLRMAIGSNLAEIYFLGHILVSIKKQTNGIAPLLSRQSLECRRRYHIQYIYLYCTIKFPTNLGMMELLLPSQFGNW